MSAIANHPFRLDANELARFGLIALGFLRNRHIGIRGSISDVADQLGVGQKGLRRVHGLADRGKLEDKRVWQLVGDGVLGRVLGHCRLRPLDGLRVDGLDWGAFDRGYDSLANRRLGNSDGLLRHVDHGLLGVRNRDDGLRHLTVDNRLWLPHLTGDH